MYFKISKTHNKFRQPLLKALGVLRYLTKDEDHTIYFDYYVCLPVLASDIEESKEHIKKMETKESQLSEKRKQRSEIILNKYSVPINNYLPYIEDENEALARNKTDIAMRAMTLLIVAVKAEGLEQEIVESLIKGYRLENSLTPNEKKFLYDPSPSEHDKTQFIWRYDGVFQGSCRLSC